MAAPLLRQLRRLRLVLPFRHCFDFFETAIAIETLVSWMAEIANPTIMTVVKSIIVYPAIR